MKENIKDTAELSSLERTAEPSALARFIRRRRKFYDRAEFFKTYEIIKII